MTRPVQRGGRGLDTEGSAGIRAALNGHGARVLRTSRVTALLVGVAVLGLCAGVLWGSAERLADQRAPAERPPAVIGEQ